MSKPTIVIVGAGFGGLLAAEALRKFDGDVVILDRANHHLFQPLLYQVAMAGLSPAQIAVPIRQLFEGRRNVRVLMTEVNGVDVERNVVHHTFGEQPYDKLIIATGATHSYFGRDEWREHAPGLKSLDDATLIRRNVLLAFEQAESIDDEEEQRRLLTFVLVGGGPTGVELSGSIAELARRALAKDFRKIDPTDARVVLVEAGPRLLAAFPEKLSEAARRDLNDLGVEVRISQRVTSIDEDGVEIGDERIEARNVIWAAGVQASAAARWLGSEADRAGRVTVDPTCRPNGQENVYVIGDTALFEQEGKPLPGVAQVAMQQGVFVAKHAMAQLGQGKDPGTFRYVDKGTMATIGRRRAVALLANRVQVTGFPAWLMWLFIHLVYLVGFKNRVGVLIEWIANYITYERGARLITGAGPLEPEGVKADREKTLA